MIPLYWKCMWQQKPLMGSRKSYMISLKGLETKCNIIVQLLSHAVKLQHVSIFAYNVALCVHTLLLFHLSYYLLVQVISWQPFMMSPISNFGYQIILKTSVYFFFVKDCVILQHRKGQKHKPSSISSSSFKCKDDTPWL